MIGLGIGIEIALHVSRANNGLFYPASIDSRVSPSMIRLLCPRKECFLLCLHAVLDGNYPRFYKMRTAHEAYSHSSRRC